MDNKQSKKAAVVIRRRPGQPEKRIERRSGF
jgi:hypothetical protein